MYRNLTYGLIFLICNFIFIERSKAEGQIKTFLFHYKFDNSVFNLDYKSNAHTYTQFKQLTDSLHASQIDSIVVLSTSSPEGSTRYNRRLTSRRSKATAAFLCTHHQELHSRFIIKEKEEAWDQLRQHISLTSALTAQQKAEALFIIDSIPSIKEKKARFTHLPYYSQLKHLFYADIRNSIITIYIKPQAPATRLLPPPETMAQPTWSLPVAPQTTNFQEQQIRVPKRTIFTIKTNLLYDAITAVNFAVEVPIGDRWSVEVEDVCPWWHHENKWAFQFWQMGAEGRYWFKRPWGNRMLTGHFGGLYGMGGKYDLQNRRNICYQGEFWSVGLTYGYAMPLGRHFNMEFSLSVGYMGTNYRHYVPSVNWDELVVDPYKRGRFSYLGPTKAKISLIYPINVKLRKKGVQHD